MTRVELYMTDRIVGNLRYVPANGSDGFKRGSPLDEACRKSDETPFRHVISPTLLVMETEATRDIWNRLRAEQPLLPADPSNTSQSSGPTGPTQNLTWLEALLFANLTAGTLLDLEGVAWFCANADSTTHPAGAKNSKPWNMKDVHGNMWEWCWDRFGDYPSGIQTDYTCSDGGSYRVGRRGGWSVYALSCRSANRVERSTCRNGIELRSKMLGSRLPFRDRSVDTPGTGACREAVSGRRDG